MATAASPARAPPRQRRWTRARPRTTTSTGATSPHELRTRIAEKGLGRAELAAVVDRQRPERPTKDELVRTSRVLLGPFGITEHRSTFSRRDAIQQWATIHRQGESADRILRLTDQWLAQREIVALEPASAAAGGTANQLPLVLDDDRADLRYSTRALLATEQAAASHRGRGSRRRDRHRSDRDRQAGADRAPGPLARAGRPGVGADQLRSRHRKRRGWRRCGQDPRPRRRGRGLYRRRPPGARHLDRQSGRPYARAGGRHPRAEHHPAARRSRRAARPSRRAPSC